MRHYAYALCRDEAEYAIVVAAARAEGLSVSNFIRRCINAYLLEADEQTPLLVEIDSQRGRPPMRESR